MIEIFILGLIMGGFFIEILHWVWDYAYMVGKEKEEKNGKIIETIHGKWVSKPEAVIHKG